MLDHGGMSFSQIESELLRPIGEEEIEVNTPKTLEEIIIESLKNEPEMWTVDKNDVDHGEVVYHENGTVLKGYGNIVQIVSDDIGYVDSVKYKEMSVLVGSIKTCYYRKIREECFKRAIDRFGK
jgi:hypothetical protein